MSQCTNYLSQIGLINSRTIARYIWIFHLKNAGSVHDDFWCLFINVWNVMIVLLINISNWILPGIYTPTYEICSCISQDYNLPKKFEKTAMVLSLTILLVSAFVAIQIKIYKRKIKLTVVPIKQSHIVTNKFPNKLVVDLTLTIGSVILIMASSGIVYIIGSKHTKVDFKILQLIYLIMMPIVFNLFSILFYAKNVNARKIIYREFVNCIINCQQQ